MTCILTWQILQRWKELAFHLSFKKFCELCILTHIFMWVFNRTAAELPSEPDQATVSPTLSFRFFGQGYSNNWNSLFNSVDYLILYLRSMA